MRSSFGLGRVFGIKLAVDWSWLFIFVLVTWNLAAGVIPALHPGWGPGLTLGLAVVAALLFFSSVLVHELATRWSRRRRACRCAVSRSSSSAVSPTSSASRRRRGPSS